MCVRCAQGHFQIMFSRQYCPLFQRRLSPLMRLLYCSGVWSYVVGRAHRAALHPHPAAHHLAGMFPIVVSWWAAGERALPLVPASTVGGAVGCG